MDNPSESSAIVTLRRQQALDSFWSFLGLLEFDRVSEQEHRPLCDFLQGYEASDEKIATVICSRDSLKTTITSIAFPLWLLCRDPNDRILLDAETKAQVRLRIDSMQNLVDNKRLLSLCFPGLHGDDRFIWNKNEFSVGTRTDFSAKENSVETCSIEQAKTGSHAKWVIMDDLVGPDNNLKEPTVAVVKHIRAMAPLLSSTKGETGKFIFVATPWTESDAVAWIQELLATSDIPHRKFTMPAFYPQDMDIDKYKTEAEFEKDGGILNYPNSLPFTKLKFDRKLMGVSLFMSQMQLIILPDEDALFKTDCVRTISMSQMPQNVRFYVQVDQAGDPTQQTSPTKRDSDRTAVVVTAIDSLGKIYVVDGACGRFTETETIEFVYMFCQNYKRELYPLVCPEKIGMNSLAANIRTAFRQRGLFVGVQDMKHLGRSKFSRIADLEIPIAHGEVFIIDTCPLKEALIYELKRFSRGGGMPKYDDISDALAWVMPLKAQYGMPMVDGSEQDTLLMEAVDGDSRNFQFWRGQRDARVRKAAGKLVSQYSELVY